LIGMEALLRWKDEELGYVPPNEFIPIAERMGIMYSMGEWIIRQAFLQIKEWNTTYNSNLVMGINISPSQLEEEYFTDTFFGIMEGLEIDPKWIDIELTEKIALNGIVNSSDSITRLKRRGVRITVDDFGTGYETFANMINFSFNRVKIAKELVDNIIDNQNAKVIVQAIVNMVDGMNLDMIAEGVEEKEQLDILLEMGCKEVQGFYFGKPIPATAFEEFWLR
nr:EAL domain-containing protein [Lachnospiraceae bacterium]